MIRDYILHDRGNSLYLGDSFANLPSPVNEDKTIKNLFKAKDEDDKKGQKKAKADKSSLNDNIKIKVEGKDP